MWHPTTEEPREGAKVVAMNSTSILRGVYRGKHIHHGSFGCSWFARFTHWAYAPGGEA